MTYDEALTYWFAHVNYEQKAPAPDDFKLDRMRALLARLGDPHRDLRIVHIAGSKGKGSVSALLATVLQRAGHRVGLFTSPHLTALEERIQIDGVPITRPELTQAIADIRDAAGRAAPTFFEICTAIGFLHFRRRHVGAAVVEVGLGGRLDSTNVCDPALSVITSISYDHTKVLGERLAQIAREKAGIIKPGRPVVSGVTLPEPKAAIDDVARRQRAALVRLGEEFRFDYEPGALDRTLQRVRVRTAERVWPWLELNLWGEHQAANAAVTVASVEQLRRLGWWVPDAAVAAGLREVRWPARMEVMRRDPYVVLDCAHNGASALALVRTLDASFPPGLRTLVFAASNDKDIAGMFEHMRGAFGRVIFTRYTNNPRAVPPGELVRLWGGGEVAEPPAEALRAALAAGGPVVITGSVFLAGELRPMLV